MGDLSENNYVSVITTAGWSFFNFKTDLGCHFGEMVSVVRVTDYCTVTKSEQLKIGGQSTEVVPAV